MSESTVPMDDSALFNAATADEAPAEATPAATEAPAAEPQIEQPADAGPARDEHGRFAPKVEAQPAETVVQPPAQSAEKPPAQAEAKHEPPPGWIPAWRAREIADRARAEAEAKYAKPVEPIDPYVDPEKFRDQGVKQAVTPLEQGLAATREYFSRKDAIRSHGLETVQAAYNWLQQASQAGDPRIAPLIQRMTASIDPFEDIVSAFKREKALSTVGDDPDAWFEKEAKRRAAENPQWHAAFQTAPAQPQQQPNNGSPPSNIVKLPPSLSRVTGADSSATGSMDGADLYAHATR